MNIDHQTREVVFSDISSLRFALLLPCLNEETTLRRVIRDFRAEIPNLDVYVFDNGSTDRSVDIAMHEKATVYSVPKRGKGNVVRKMFELVEADIYILVDSDDTYDAKGVWQILKPVLLGEADMTVASRLETFTTKAFRPFHKFGNNLILSLINSIFRSRLQDICSGYRVMSRNFVKNIPLLRDGFEIEAELTVHSLMYGFHIKEVSLPYRSRPANSHSKLRTLQDGYRVLLTIVGLARDLRPLLFFASVALILFLATVLPIWVLARSALFPQIALTTLSVGLFLTGLVLNTINVRFSELQSIYRRNFAPALPQSPQKPTRAPVVN